MVKSQPSKENKGTAALTFVAFHNNKAISFLPTLTK